MKERIKALRKENGLTQAEFGARIGVKGNTITTYETGARVPSDSVILSICREFGVNEIWLREGVGEMFRKKSRNEELADFFGDLQFGDSGFKQAFVTVLARMGPEEWQMIERKARELAEEIKKADP